jgi:hypothetical protein
LIVIFLTGVLVRIGLSGLAAILEVYQLNSTVHQLQSDIAKLRSQALATGCSQSLDVTREGSQYSGHAGISCFSGDYNPDDLTSFTHSLPSTLRLVMTSPIHLNSRGFVVDAVGHPSEMTVGFLCRGTPCGTKTISILGVLL